MFKPEYPRCISIELTSHQKLKISGMVAPPLEARQSGSQVSLWEAGTSASGLESCGRRDGGTNLPSVERGVGGEGTAMKKAEWAGESGRRVDGRPGRGEEGMEGEGAQGCSESKKAQGGSA
jgi:hypothetical protein